VFAAIALFLAIAGVYGLITFNIGQRSKEIGVRIALGARRSSVVRLVLGQALILAGLGLLLGLPIAVAGARVLNGLLFQVKPHDPLVYVAVATLLGVVAVAASYIPATRASSIDPLTALRQD